MSHGASEVWWMEWSVSEEACMGRNLPYKQVVAEVEVEVDEGHDAKDEGNTAYLAQGEGEEE